MFSKTEIKIINFLRKTDSGMPFSSALLRNCQDFQACLCLLEEKGIITIDSPIDKNEILGHVTLTDFGYTYPM